MATVLIFSGICSGTSRSWLPAFPWWRPHPRFASWTKHRRSYLRSLFGKETAKALLPVNYLQKQSLILWLRWQTWALRAAGKISILFINGRAVQHRLIHHAVKEAFSFAADVRKTSLVFTGYSNGSSFGGCKCASTQILEVRFVNQSEMYGAVHGAVKHALEAALLLLFRGNFGLHSIPVATASLWWASVPFEL